PRDGPMLSWADPITLPWSDEERGELSGPDLHRHLLDEQPPGVHGRPEGAAGSTTVLALWNYDVRPVEPTFPIEVDPSYPELVIRGLARMIPALATQLGRLPRCTAAGAYRAQTPEHRSLAGAPRVPRA